jgi:lactoylglutathione lyase
MEVQDFVSGFRVSPLITRQPEENRKSESQPLKTKIPMLKRLLHTRYRVQDLAKTVHFYKDVLGLEEVRRHTSPRGSELVFFKAPGSDEEIEICKFDESGPVNVGFDTTHLAFEVDDLDAFAKQAAAKGYPLSDGPTPTGSGSVIAFIDAPEATRSS